MAGRRGPPLKIATGSSLDRQNTGLGRIVLEPDEIGGHPTGVERLSVENQAPDR